MATPPEGGGFLDESFVPFDQRSTVEPAALTYEDIGFSTTLVAADRVSNLGATALATMEFEGVYFNLQVHGDDQSQTLKFGPIEDFGNFATGLSSANIDLKGGNDSISFKPDSETLSSRVMAGVGADTIVFANNAFSGDTTVDLGNDADVDSVELKDENEHSNFTVKNFGDDDRLIVGSTTYNYADLQASGGQAGPNVRVSFIEEA